MTTTRTLDERRTDTARRLTDEVGYQVDWNKTCFSLWDGSNRWFPLYTVAQVLNTAARLDKPTACVHVNIMNGYGFLRAKLIYPDGRVTQIGSAAGPDAYAEMVARVKQWSDQHGYNASVFAGSGTLTPR